MAEYDPNPQQREFLLAGNCNLLVSASAGSGKTSTMIQKLIKIMCEEKVAITSLLVVTYTNAAASEIKLKLYNEISKLVIATDDDNTKSFLKEQLENINNAEIGTLHAICRKLIVKYFYELEESPDFGLLSDKEQKYLIDLAVNNVFSKHISSNDEEFFELYDCYNSNRNDLKLKKMALQLYDFKVSKTDYLEWKNNFLQFSYNCDTFTNPACSYLLNYYQRRVLSYSNQILQLKNFAEDNAFERYYAYINARYQFVNEFSLASDFDTAVKIIDNLLLPDKPRFSDKLPVEEQEFDERIADFGASFGDLITKIKTDFTSTDIGEIKDNIKIARNNVIKLLGIVDEIEETYRLIKKKKNVLDFNDLEDKMLKLLENDTIRGALKSQYYRVFVDEYQDINYKQEKILLNLVSKNNYYMIGDVKQSIYAFRQSSPEIFVDKYDAFSKNDNDNRVINFNINYRSDRNILEFANGVFDKLITKGTIGIDYVADARFQSKRKYEGCNVSIGIINKEEKTIDKEEIEAKVIVEKIIDVIKTQKEDGSYYNYGDIAIILRSRGTFVKTLCEVLNKHQIPVRASVVTDFFGTSEIQLLISVLKVISNYKDDVSLSVVLKNLFGVTEDELMCIRAFKEDVALCEAIIDYSQDNEIKSKIRECFDFIELSRKKLTSMTIRDYLSEVIEQFDLLLRLKIKTNGHEKANNVLEFLKIADNVSYQYNIDSFLDYLDIISKDNTPKTVGAGNNAVEICTIHHSKGLEYPVVILGRLGTAFQLNKDSGNIIMNSKFGVGLKSIDSKNRTLQETVIRSACKIDNKKSEIDEEIRLLYVAMTRAKEKLFLIGCYDLTKLSINKHKDTYNTTTALDMIFKSVSDADVPCFDTKKDFVLNEGGENDANVRIYDMSDFGEELEGEKKPVILNTTNISLTNTLKNVLLKTPETEVTTIKNTVTNILREESDYENLNFVPRRLDPTDKVPSKDALKLGTAYHTVMQEINFNENYIQIEELIHKLVVDGKIDKEMSGLIKIEEILKAISVLKPLIDKSKKIYKEKQFLLCENYNKLLKSTDNNTKVIVQGVIDLVVESDNEICLIDYKTNRGVTAEDLKKEYALQLELYAHAFEEATNLNITHKFLYSFKLGELIEVE